MQIHNGSREIEATNRSVLTTNSRFFVLLEVVVHEPEYEGRLPSEVTGQRSTLRAMFRIHLTLPTAASPSKTSLTLLDGLGVVAVESAIAAVRLV